MNKHHLSRKDDAAKPARRIVTSVTAPPKRLEASFSKLKGACASGELVHKPDVLVAALAGG